MGAAQGSAGGRAGGGDSPAAAREDVAPEALRKRRLEKNPCFPKLEEYVKCMEQHEGRAPDPYEGEWCEEQKELYKLCRQKLKAERRESRGEGRRARRVETGSS